MSASKNCISLALITRLVLLVHSEGQLPKKMNCPIEVELYHGVPVGAEGAKGPEVDSTPQ